MVLKVSKVFICFFSLGFSIGLQVSKVFICFFLGFSIGFGVNFTGGSIGLLGFCVVVWLFLMVS